MSCRPSKGPRKQRKDAKIGWGCAKLPEYTNALLADVQEEPPTSDQLSSILEYLGPSKAGSVVQDATGSSDALRKFKASPDTFRRPVTVDWNNGRAGT